jgi:hypothetical protein
MIRSLLAALLASIALVAPASAQAPLERRASEAAGIISEKPSWPKGLFHASFSAQVSDAQLIAIGSQFFSKCGAVKAVQRTSSKGPNLATFDLITEKGLVVPMTIGIQDKAPNEVSTLFFGAPVPMLKTVDEAAKALAKLGGQMSFGVWRLGEGDPEPLVTIEPDLPLAIGSAFKLYLLGTLADDVKAGRRKLSETATLGPATRSWPSGQLQDWPDGAPVTLDTAANLMISVSDNTATDLLLSTLGRARVEAMLPTMGMKNPARNRPFLGTGEMFRLKFIDGGKAGEAYAALDEAGRRAFLENGLPKTELTRDALDPSAFGGPNRIDSIEWFASASDLCRAMEWLRRNTEGAAGSDACLLRGALAISRGLDISTTQFPWAGFKGGSEPGVLNLSFLLKRADGTWFAVVATWNDPDEALDEQALMPIVQRTIWLIGQGAAKPGDADAKP